MPTYEFECPGCGRREDRLFKIADRPDTVPCQCGQAMRFVISCPMVQCDDPVNTPWLREFCHSHNRQGGKRDRFGDKPLESRQGYKEYLKRHDLRPTGDGFNLSEV